MVVSTLYARGCTRGFVSGCKTVIAGASIFGAGLSVTAPLHAQSGNAVSLRSDVMVERAHRDAAGRMQISLTEPTQLNSGDRLIFIVNYRNNSAHTASGFMITNPMPNSVAFLGTSDNQAHVSVDGGRSWGQLSQLQTTDSDGTRRRARAEDVTHIRWSFARPLASGQSGRLIYRGIVR